MTLNSHQQGVTSKNQVGFAKFALKGFKAAEFIKSKLQIKNKDKTVPESTKSGNDTTPHN